MSQSIENIGGSPGVDLLAPAPAHPWQALQACVLFHLPTWHSVWLDNNLLAPPVLYLPFVNQSALASKTTTMPRPGRASTLPQSKEGGGWFPWNFALNPEQNEHQGSQQQKLAFFLLLQRTRKYPLMPLNWLL